MIIITKNELINKTVEISGVVTDEQGEPIEFANVILYENGNTTSLKQGSTTNSQGAYSLVNILPGNYLMKISFVGYETITEPISVDNQLIKIIKRNFQLKTNTQTLQEVVVAGERPALKAEAGKLVFYMPTLLKSKAISNAYDAIKEIPGVIEQNATLTLIGTSGTTVLLDGKKTNMTTDQLMNLLRSTPSERLENVEIMYSVPPQYNIRGSAINVMLKKAKNENAESSWQGEVVGTLAQRKYLVGSGRTNLLYAGKKTTVDLLYAYGNYTTHNAEVMKAEHKIQYKTHLIDQENGGISKFQTHKVRLAVDYELDNKDKMEASYVGSFDQTNSTRTALTSIDGEKIKSDMQVVGPSKMHNFKADYAFHFGLKLGAEHTYYDDNSTNYFYNTLENTNTTTDKITSASRQQINRSFFYANQTHSLKNGWTLNYGGNYSLVNSKNYSDAVRNDTIYRSATFNNKQNETIWNAFAGFTKSFSEKLSMQASLAVEHYEATETSAEKTTELWNNMALFPTLSVNYNVSANHIFQFSLSADKEYPSYWSLNPTVYHFNAYGVTYGNPHLQPIRIYDLGLTYIYKQKYVVRPYFNHIVNFYNQMPYQSPDKLEQVFMEQNFDFRQQIGLLGVIPFQIGKRISSRLTLNGIYWREKDSEFFTLSFDRKTFLGYAQFNADVNLSDKPNLKLNISGYAITPTGIQGLYDLGASGDLSAGITWTFDHERAKLMLKADDIFKTQTPFASIDYQGQKSSINATRDTRAVEITFLYRFGGYKAKDRKEVDTSRFGTN